ncbi:hypothetical protein [Flexivirga meconopsidis]|uniref:hypothetical protein n=1 Tax=Flexivirga meconopsidis TaxID=2977121 RepID=UPI00223E9F10|nr:hypothetical protein [Flexivirga meconopsidis]
MSPLPYPEPALTDVAVGLIASQQVLRGAGYLEEGRLRSFLTSGGTTSDALVFSVVSPGEAD